MQNAERVWVTVSGARDSRHVEDLRERERERSKQGRTKKYSCRVAGWQIE